MSAILAERETRRRQLTRKSVTALKTELRHRGHLQLDGWTKEELINEVLNLEVGPLAGQVAS